MAQQDEKELERVVERACARAQQRGARQAMARASVGQQHRLVLRDGKQEELRSAISRDLSIDLYVDGRYSTHSTSVLQEQALGRFIDDAVAMTRLLMPDPHRSLPDPALYAERSAADLRIFDPNHGDVTVGQRKERAMAAHEAARQAAGKKLLSVEGGASDSHGLMVMQTTNGFRDARRSTSFGVWASVSIEDPSGRRPSDYDQASARIHGELADPAAVGRSAAERTLATLGADKISSLELPVIVENRAVSRVLEGLLAPLSGWALDQKRSCMDGRLGERIAAPLLSILDDPFVPAGWGSRHFDGEGITARKRPVLERGVLRNYYIDSYYGRKLQRAPTTGGASNLVFDGGAGDVAALCRQAERAVLVTDFLGGNSNSTTGDFSHGIAGFLIEKGQRSRPIASMNVAGNHLTWWQTLQALGADHYPYASYRTPSLLFAPMVVAGK